jgi:drug/metabolite transporter (DMT)-like permease
MPVAPEGAAATDREMQGAAGAPMRAQGLHGVDLFLAILFCLLWSASFLASKTALRDIEPLVLLAARYITAGIILLGVAAAVGMPKLTRRDLVKLICIGLVLHGLHLAFSWYGLERVSSGFAAIMFSTSPILIAFLAAPVLGETMTMRKLLGLALGIVGVAIVFRSRLGGGVEDPLGAVFVMIGVAALVAGTVAYKRLAPGGGLWLGQAVQFLAAGIGIIPVMLLLNDVSSTRPTLSLLAGFLYLVFGSAIGTYSLWLYLVSRTGASTASSLLFLTPPLGLMIGWLALDEPLALADLIGIVPIAIGIRLATTA